MEWTVRFVLLGVVLLAVAGAIGKVFGPSAERRFLRALDIGSAGLLWIGVAAIAAVVVIAVITSFL